MKGICKNCQTEFNYTPSQSGGIYCSNKCQGEYTILKRFVKGSKWNQRMRNYLIEHRDYRCGECGITEYNGKPITLQIDHKDGDRKNNTFENLQFLCPNCHSQTDTWGVGNISEDGKLRIIKGAKLGAEITKQKYKVR